MKTSFLSIIGVVLFSVLFSGCKKYDEGSFITLRSVKNRLTNGDWILQEITENGTNTTSDYNEIDFKYTFNASDGLGAKSYNYAQTYTFQGQLYQVTGDITFSDNGDKMEMILYYDYNYSGYYAPIFSYDSNNQPITWTIKKLTNKELWMETILDSKPVSMKLKKDK